MLTLLIKKKNRSSTALVRRQTRGLSRGVDGVETVATLGAIAWRGAKWGLAIWGLLMLVNAFAGKQKKEAKS